MRIKGGHMKKAKHHLGMVDITEKNKTKRTALASATVSMSAGAFKLFVKKGSPKGNVLETARVAGIMAAKNTPNFIPLCHPLELGKANVSFVKDSKKHSVVILSEVAYEGKTGVEMEALSAVTVAALTIYDMMKWADKSIVIRDVKLLQKTGGKSGDYRAGF